VQVNLRRQSRSVLAGGVANEFTEVPGTGSGREAGTLANTCLTQPII